MAWFNSHLQDGAMCSWEQNTSFLYKNHPLFKSWSLYAEVLKYDKQLNEQRLNHKLGAAPLQLVKFLWSLSAKHLAGYT